MVSGGNDGFVLALLHPKACGFFHRLDDAMTPCGAIIFAEPGGPARE